MKDARREQAAALMASLLPAGRRLVDEYPLAFDERFRGEIVTLEEQGAVRSACAILPREFVCGARRLQIGLIGSVVTEPAFRGRKLMTRLLDQAEARLAALGCSLALLWADESAVYASRGYLPFGHEIDFWADAALCAALPPCPLARPATLRDSARIHALYAAHSLRVERTLDETRALLGCPDMDCLVLPRSQASPELDAYACVGRGHDLANVVHEWGGAPDAVLWLVRAHQARRLASGLEPELVVMAPGESTHLHTLFDSLGARRFDGILGLAKPLDARWLASELARAGERLEVSAIAGPLGASALVAQSAHGRRELPLGQVVQALFPPGGDLAAYHHLADVLRTTLAVPLHPFAWGLDSI